MMLDSAPVAPQALAVCGDGDVCQGIDGTQKSKVWVHSLFDPGEEMVRPPGFEPGLPAWKAEIITRLDYGRSRRETIVRGYDLRVLMKWTQLDESVEGLDHFWCRILHTRQIRTGQWKAGISLGAGLTTPVGAYRSVEGLYHILITSLATLVCTYRSVEGCDPERR